MIYKSEEHKLRGIAGEILRIFCKQQPVLVGTRSIEMSERVSARMRPVTLSLLCMVEVAREKLELSKAIDANRKREYTTLLNIPMEPHRDKESSKLLPALNMTRLKNLLKDVDLIEDPLTPENMNAIARLFEINDAGLDYLEEALTQFGKSFEDFEEHL